MHSLHSLYSVTPGQNTLSSVHEVLIKASTPPQEQAKYQQSHQRSVSCPRAGVAPKLAPRENKCQCTIAHEVTPSHIPFGTFIRSCRCPLQDMAE